MPLSDMLFGNTHNVEQIVDIKHKKSVDKVLLKVIKTVRERGSIPGWINVTSDLRKDFNVTERQMKSICNTLGTYYNVSIDPEQMNTPGDIVGLIKAHKAQATDSLYLIDRGSVIQDEDDELEPKENLEVDPEIIKKSEPSVPSNIPVPENAEASTEEGDDDKTVPIDAVGKVGDEGILAVALGGYSAVELATEIAALYREHNWDKLVEKMTQNYTKIIADIRKNHKDDPAFKANRAILYPAKVLKSAFATRLAQLKKLCNMPFPIIGEDVELSKKKLNAYFGSKMSMKATPGDPSYMTLEDAGYLNPYVTRDLITKLQECFNAQDTLDSRLFPYLRKADGEKYKPVLEEVGAADYFHAMYKEEWTEHFSTHVMKAIVNGLQGKSNSEIGSEQLEPEKKVEASMESVTTVQTEETPADWGSMLESL